MGLGINPGTHEGNFLIEIAGLGKIFATEVSGLSKNNRPFELGVGNQNFPELGPGTFSIGEVRVRHAHGISLTDQEVFQWFDDYADRIDTTQRSGSFVILDSDGETPLAEYAMFGVVPLNYEVDTHTALGQNASMFNFSFRPTNLRRLA